MLISVLGGRFPRARLQSPRHYVPAGLSVRVVSAGVAAFHSNQQSVNLIFMKKHENILTFVCIVRISNYEIDSYEKS